MRRPWLVWAISIAAFFLTVILAIAFDSAQAPLAQIRQSVSSLPAGRASTDVTPAPSAEGDPTQTVDLPTDLPATLSANFPSGSLTQTGLDYRPPEEVFLANPTNYGERYTVDAVGTPVSNDYIVVLHETVGSAQSAINTFQAPNLRDEDQVSYHTLISADGTVIYVVPPEQRAFGAGDSAFKTASGEESVTTNSGFPSSVNNFAYHISLESPPDGRNNGALTHSGYTEAQYRSLAWLLSRTTIPDERITTHEAVDRSGSRIDPRSFDRERLLTLLHQYPNRASLQ
ncbi:peptidoglycan recognition family protein [Leptolyngbya sp. BC1307]|uniref:N-acetylmuramoyl-L-alanine amidase n=1 Tax=Leptolyngbya sp. BC1307 TaxID=2029589 RepID=UPI000EFD47C5|nr:peptidoglycan recognition family protein [Leptolyngbya sp. BC1307]